MSEDFWSLWGYSAKAFSPGKVLSSGSKNPQLSSPRDCPPSVKLHPDGKSSGPPIFLLLHSAGLCCSYVQRGEPSERLLCECPCQAAHCGVALRKLN